MDKTDKRLAQLEEQMRFLVGKLHRQHKVLCQHEEKWFQVEKINWQRVSLQKDNIENFELNCLEENKSTVRRAGIDHIDTEILELEQPIDNIPYSRNFLS